MTFCLGMRVKDGLVGIADTRVTSGSECITARKVSVYQGDGWTMFMMTAGLRSVRDKALTYFDEVMERVGSAAAESAVQDGQRVCRADSPRRRRGSRHSWSSRS